MSKRAAIIVTDARYVDGVTLRRGDDSWNDEAEQLWLETSEQLLADLRDITTFVIDEVFDDDLLAAAERVRAAIGGL